MKTTIQALLASIIILNLGAGVLQAAEPDDDPAGDGMDIIVVFKTHFDIGYTALASEVIDRYRTSMIDDALKVVDQYRDLPVEQQLGLDRPRDAKMTDVPSHSWILPGWAGWVESPIRQRKRPGAFAQGRGTGWIRKGG
jgi:hypothetical protein